MLGVSVRLVLVTDDNLELVEDRLLARELEPYLKINKKL